MPYIYFTIYNVRVEGAYNKVSLTPRYSLNASFFKKMKTLFAWTTVYALILSAFLVSGQVRLNYVITSVWSWANGVSVDSGCALYLVVSCRGRGRGRPITWQVAKWG